MRTPGQPGTRTGRAGRAVQGRRDERGVALVIAIGVIVVTLSLSLLVVTIALRQNESSRVDRTRAVAVNAAEAGVDATFAALQSAGSTLPCGPDAIPDLNAQVPVDEPQVTIDVQYFQADGVTPITDCATVQANASHSTMRALITATGQSTTFAGGSTQGKRAMQAFVTIRPIIADGFDNAIFADDSLEVKNYQTVSGNEGNDADIYSNGSINCENGSNQIYEGSIYSQGSVDLGGTCDVLGNVWANGAVSIGHNSTVGHNVTSSTSSVSVDVKKSLDEQVGGTITAGTSISAGSCPTGKCIPDSPQGPPPQQPFPQLSEESISAWSQSPPTGPGYQLLDEHYDCATVADRMEQLAEAESSAPGFVIPTDCKVAFSGNTDVEMVNDLVIYARGGFSSTNNVSFTSGDGESHRLYWIVPFEASTSCDAGDAGDIAINNNFGPDDGIELMLYTPCDIDIQNHADYIHGQIYGGGTVKIDNNFAMEFQPLPVYGVDPTSLPLLSHDVDVIYKREVRP